MEGEDLFLYIPKQLIAGRGHLNELTENGENRLVIWNEWTQKFVKHFFFCF